MTITHAAIEWSEDYDNAPSLYIEVDGFLPSREDYRYEQRGSCFFAQHESGLCSFFSYSGPSKDGYGGATFDITMVDGTKRALIGPWSGNELSMAAAGFPMTYSGRAKARANWGDGWSTSYGIHLLEPLWRETIERFCPDAHLVRANVGKPYSAECSLEQNVVIGCAAGEKAGVETFLIARKGMTYAQSQAFKRVKRFSRYAAEVRDEPVTYSYQKSPTDQRMGHVAYVNELIAHHGLEQWAKPFDLANLPPFLPARPPEPVYSYDPEGDES